MEDKFDIDIDAGLIIEERVISMGEISRLLQKL